MGRFRSLFEIAYNHYVERKGLEMPYTQIVLGMIRPEGPGFTCDNRASAACCSIWEKT